MHVCHVANRRKQCWKVIFEKKNRFVFNFFEKKKHKISIGTNGIEIWSLAQHPDKPSTFITGSSDGCVIFFLFLKNYFNIICFFRLQHLIVEWKNGQYQEIELMPEQFGKFLLLQEKEV